MSSVTCHLSPVTSHLSPVTFHLSSVTCHQIKKNQHFEEAIVEETNFDDSCVHDPGLFIRALVEDKNNWAYHFNIAGFSVIPEKDPLMQAMWHYIAYGVTLPNHYYRGLKDTGKSVDVEEFIMEKIEESHVEDMNISSSEQSDHDQDEAKCTAVLKIFEVLQCCSELQ